MTDEYADVELMWQDNSTADETKRDAAIFP